MDPVLLPLLWAAVVVFGAATLSGLLSSRSRKLLLLSLVLSTLPYFIALHRPRPADRRALAVALAERAVLKLAPMGALVQMTLSARRSAVTSGRYALRLVGGLALSSVGDLALEFNNDDPEGQLFLVGLASFFVAHVLYICAFVGQSHRPLGAPTTLAVVGGAAFGIFRILQHAPRMKRELVPPVAAYCAVIAAMVWRAAVRLHDRAAACPASQGSRCAALAGAVSFMISDAVLAFSKFHTPFGAAKDLVMVTYYGGQLGIAWSVWDSEGEQRQGAATAKKNA
eukprot:g7098.t1